MNLDITWSAPSPVPGCGYRALYRRKSDPSYTEIDTSGNTLSVSVEAPASYEGKLVSDCCSESTSPGAAFGVNAYDTIVADVAYDPDTQGALLTLTTTYASVYDTIVNGIVDIDYGIGPVTTPFEVTYPAGSTTYTTVLMQAIPSAVFTDLTIGGVSPIFGNGGELQQYDAVNTPPYYKLYWEGNVSGTTWAGSPSELPSFTLDAFTPTEYDVDENVLAGVLNMSYIIGEQYSNDFNTLTMEVYDATSVLIGTTTLTKAPNGLRQASIALEKASSELSTSTEFTMKVLWPDLTLIDTKVFYLPDF